jgi:hypothetical protein
VAHENTMNIDNYHSLSITNLNTPLPKIMNDTRYSFRSAQSVSVSDFSKNFASKVFLSPLKSGKIWSKGIIDINILKLDSHPAFVENEVFLLIDEDVRIIAKNLNFIKKER